LILPGLLEPAAGLLGVLVGAAGAAGVRWLNAESTSGEPA